MARPKLNPKARFSDVLPMWAFAAENGGMLYECTSVSDAIHKMHRLHMARAAIRETDGINGIHLWDEYKVQIEHNVVKIVIKEPLDMTRFRYLSGEKVPEQTAILQANPGLAKFMAKAAADISKLEVEKTAEPNTHNPHDSNKPFTLDIE